MTNPLASPAQVVGWPKSLVEAEELVNLLSWKVKWSLLSARSTPSFKTWRSPQLRLVLIQATSVIESQERFQADRGRLQPTDFRYRPGAQRPEDRHTASEGAKEEGHRARPRCRVVLKMLMVSTRPGAGAQMSAVCTCTCPQTAGLRRLLFWSSRACCAAYRRLGRAWTDKVGHIWLQSLRQSPDQCQVRGGNTGCACLLSESFRGFQGFRQPVPKMLVQPPCAVSSKQEARCSVFVRSKCRGLCMTFLATSELIAVWQPSLGQVAGWIIGKQGRHIRELQERQLLQDGSPS